MREIKINEQPSQTSLRHTSRTNSARAGRLRWRREINMSESGAIPSVFLERRYITVYRLEYDSQMSCARFMQIHRAAVGGPLESCDVSSVMFFGPILSHKGQTASESLQG